MTAALRSELRKLLSTKLWWALLIPVAVVAALVNLFSGVLARSITDVGGGPVLLVSIAYALGLTSTFAAVYGIVAMSSEFRHRTITTTYLTTEGRSRVLLAKACCAAGVGAVYAIVTVAVGVLAGLLASGEFPPVGPLLAELATGAAVVALWSVFGNALGTVITNQAVVLVLTLGYLLLGELLVSALLNNSGNDTLARLTSYLPGNAGDVALYDGPAQALVPQGGDRLVEAVAGVTHPPPWWGGLLLLAAWAAAATASAWVVGGRRDIT